MGASKIGIALCTILDTKSLNFSCLSLKYYRLTKFDVINRLIVSNNSFQSKVTLEETKDITTE